MVSKKRQSKRVTLKMKYKMESKVREHHRKQRRAARRAGVDGKKKKLSKDPGIPNLYPFKQQLLRQAEVRRKRMEEQNKLQHKLRSRAQNQRRGLNDLVSDAKSRAQQFEAETEQAEKDGVTDAAGHSNRRAFARELTKVIESADVLIEVLDARDPMGCRVKDLESQILGKYPTKRIILLLNKIDMVPRSAALGWLRSLRTEFPTLAFKANTAAGSNGKLGRISSSGGAATASAGALSSRNAVGADTLLQLIKNYSRGKAGGSKRGVTVGVVGYPNVGKSSVINSLKRSRVAGVSATAGFTKVMQEVQLDGKVRLLDCPGVILGRDAGGLLLRNVLSVEALPDGDALPAVTAILRRCPPEQLMQVYTIPRFGTPAEFLALVARKRGKIGKGGVPDTAAAARVVLHDWNSGRVPFYTPPPPPPAQDGSSAGAVAGTAKVVAQWGAEFDPEQMLAASESAVVEGLPDNEGEADYTVLGEESECEDGDGDATLTATAAAAPYNFSRDFYSGDDQK